jgi:hypothetical protein
MPKERRPVQTTRASARTPKPARRSLLDRVVDKVDRVARRPFLEGDYMPGTSANRGAQDDACTPRPRRRTSR